MEAIPIIEFVGWAKFQLQYVDSKEKEWTVPVILTEERLKSFQDDLSVKKIKIITSQREIELDVI